MRDRVLRTIDEQLLMADARRVAQNIDTFLLEREKSVLRKLATIGGLAHKETFEVQATTHLSSQEIQPIEAMITGSDFAIGKSSWRQQYDTYFIFHDKWASRIRYREDVILARDALHTEPVPEGQVSEVIYRLTLANQKKEDEFANSVVLSHLHFDALADRSLRFYREYFKPDEEREVHKERRRFHIRYGGTEFTINIDSLKQPALPGLFLSIRSRTWSAQDAERKADLIGKLLRHFNIGAEKLVKDDYLSLAAHPERFTQTKEK
jgi:5-methylthioadenosine/S-adenosylhomocysteine deaminase